jgi:hypothetical protein
MCIVPRTLVCLYHLGSRTIPSDIINDITAKSIHMRYPDLKEKKYPGSYTRQRPNQHDMHLGPDHTLANRSR